MAAEKYQHMGRSNFVQSVQFLPNRPMVFPNREKTPIAPMFSFATVFCTAARNRPAAPVYVIPCTVLSRASFGWYVSSNVALGSSRSAIVATGVAACEASRGILSRHQSTGRETEPVDQEEGRETRCLIFLRCSNKFSPFDLC